MVKVLDDVDLGQAIDEMIKGRVKEQIESVMRAERKSSLEKYKTKENKANGYYIVGMVLSMI